MNILLVDNLPANLLTLRAMLDGMGYHVVEARSVEEALRRLRDQDFAVVVLDVQLDGFETARRIRSQERSRHTAIIFVSAPETAASTVAKTQILPAVDYLVKPLVPEVVRAKVAGLVDPSEHSRQANRQAEQFRLLVEGTKEYAIFMLDPEGRIVTWNLGAERIKGYQSEEIIGQHFSRFYPAEDVQAGKPEQELKQAIATGKYEEEGWRVRKDGSRFWASVVITALRDETGNLRGFSKVTRDMTAHKQAEETARRLIREEAARQAAEASLLAAQRAEQEERKQREQLHVTLDSIGDAVIATDATGRVTLLNPVAEDLIGWSSAEVVGQSLEKVFNIIHEQTRQPVENPVDRVIRQGIVVGLGNHTVLIARDGTEKPIDDSAAPIRDEKGSILGVVLVFRDVTERRRLERLERDLLGQLERQAEFQQAVMANMSEGLYVVDTGGLVTYMNPAAEAIFGWTSAELVGRKMHDLTHYKHPDGTPFPIEECAGFKVLHEGKISKDYDDVFIRKDGSFFPVVYSSSPLITNGKTVGLVVVFRDVTERKTAEEALRGSERRLAAELEAMTRLHALSTRLLSADKVSTALDDVLENAIVTSGADFGNIQLYNKEIGALEIVAHRGFHQDFLHYFRTVRVGEGSACAQAMQSGQRILIEDVDLDPTYEPHRRVAAAAGYRAVQSTPIQSRDGSVLGMMSTHFRLPQRVSERNQRLLDLYARHAADLLERFRSQEALRKSEARKTAMLETALDCIVSTDHEGKIIEFNPAAEKCFGYKRAEALGQQMSELLIPRSLRGKHYEGLAGFLASGEGPIFNQRLEMPALHADGTEFPVELSITRIPGEPAVCTAFLRDIRERKRAEQDTRFLADASAALSALVDYESTLQKVARLAVPFFADWCAVDMMEANGSLRRVAVAHVDPAKLAVAEEAHRLYPPDPNAPHGPPQVIRAGRSELVAEITDAMIETGSQGEKHSTLLRELGLKSYMCVPVLIQGKALGAITFLTAESARRYGPQDLAVAEDLGQRAAVAIENARLYSEVREAGRKKDEFLAILAHELRNPLAPIRNALQILCMRGVDAGTGERARKMLERQVQQVIRLVDDLLDVSRIMQGKIELRKGPVEVATVIARAVETAQPAIDAQGHELAISLPPEPVWIEGDLVRLAQVVSNLLNNSAKYMEKDGHIWLTAKAEGQELVLRVRDTGIGIAPELLPRIFEPFVQAEHALSRAQGGLGIGLTLVHRLVKMHGGSVTAYSEGPGKGSEFTVRLPALAETPAAARDWKKETEAPSPPTLPCRRILVVDDNLDAAESLATVLRLQGQHVREAHDGAAALQVARDYRPEVVFLDIGMPRMDGYEVARRLRQEPGLESTVVVALTGWGQEEDRRRSQEAGFNHHLVKPVEPIFLSEFLASIHKEAVTK